MTARKATGSHATRALRQTGHDGPVAATDDDEAVRALIGAYAERLDAGDFDGVASLFSNGEFRSARGGAPRVGADAVRAMYEPVIRYDDGTPRTRHVLGNIVVTVDTASRSAAARCTFTVFQQPDGRTLSAVLAGRYKDRFVEVDGRWCFAERVVHPDLMGDLRMHMGAS
jgi:uncharacterized protein (TIGR02246 family)